MPEIPVSHLDKYIQVDLNTRRMVQNLIQDELERLGLVGRGGNTGGGVTPPGFDTIEVWLNGTPLGDFRILNFIGQDIQAVVQPSQRLDLYFNMPAYVLEIVIDNAGNPVLDGDGNYVVITVPSPGGIIPPPVQLPTIDSFTADDYEVTAGDPVVLSWQVRNAYSLSISGVGDVTAQGLNGNTTVNPTVDQDYVLTATSADGTQSATAVVHIAVDTPTGTPPVISSFTASPSRINVGDSSILAWEVTGATSVTLNGSAVGATGTQSVTPTVTTSYRLTATNADASVSSVVTVSVVTGVPSGDYGPGTLPGEAPENPGINLQGLLNSAAYGSTVLIEPYIYRGAYLFPAGVTVKAKPGAEIRGSDIWTNWQAFGSYYRSVQFLPSWDSNPGDFIGSQDGDNRWQQMDQVFVNGVALVQRDNGSSLEPNEFYRDGSGRVVMNVNPTGKRVEVTVRKTWLLPTGDNATIDGMIMRHCGNAAQKPATGANRHNNFTLKNCWLFDSHGPCCVFDTIDRGTMLRNEVARSGELGTWVWDSTNIQIHNNYFHGNNTEAYAFGWEAGGFKIVFSPGSNITDNRFSDNYGAGIWYDIRADRATILRNRIDHNAGVGLFYEISSFTTIGGDTIVDGNIIYENGWHGSGAPGVYISSCGNVTFKNNIVAWNNSGIWVQSQSRGDKPSDYATNTHINNNIVVQQPSGSANQGYAMAWKEDWSGRLFSGGSNNTGSGNKVWITYDGVATKADPTSHIFAWNGDINNVTSFAATAGGTGTTYMTPSEARSYITNVGISATPEAHIG